MQAALAKPGGRVGDLPTILQSRRKEGRGIAGMVILGISRKDGNGRVDQQGRMGPGTASEGRGGARQAFQ